MNNKVTVSDETNPLQFALPLNTDDEGFTCKR